MAFFHTPTHLKEEGETNLPFHLHNNTRSLNLDKISSWCWYSCLDRYIYRVLSKCERNAKERMCCPKDGFRNTKCQYLSLWFPFIYHQQADIEFSVKKVTKLLLFVICHHTGNSFLLLSLIVLNHSEPKEGSLNFLSLKHSSVTNTFCYYLTDFLIKVQMVGFGTWK